jgi:hypothetical protein
MTIVMFMALGDASQRVNILFFCVHILFLVHAKLAFGNGQFTIDVIDDSPMKTLIYRAFPSHR